MSVCRKAKENERKEYNVISTIRRTTTTTTIIIGFLPLFLANRTKRKNVHTCNIYFLNTKKERRRKRKKFLFPKNVSKKIFILTGKSASISKIISRDKEVQKYLYMKKQKNIGMRAYSNYEAAAYVNS